MDAMIIAVRLQRSTSCNNSCEHVSFYGCYLRSNRLSSTAEVDGIVERQSAGESTLYNHLSHIITIFSRLNLIYDWIYRIIPVYGGILYYLCCCALSNARSHAQFVDRQLTAGNAFRWLVDRKWSVHIEVSK